MGELDESATCYNKALFSIDKVIVKLQPFPPSRQNCWTILLTYWTTLALVIERKLLVYNVPIWGESCGSGAKSVSGAPARQGPLSQHQSNFFLPILPSDTIRECYLAQAASVASRASTLAASSLL